MIAPRTSALVDTLNRPSTELLALEAVGGEALQGSGFENEQPEPGFKDGDWDGYYAKVNQVLTNYHALPLFAQAAEADDVKALPAPAVS